MLRPFCETQQSTMTLYIANLLQPFFGKVREALLHNPMAGESLVPIIRCEATTTSNPIREQLRPLTYIARSDAVIIEQLRSFVNDLFPEPRLSALNHIPPYDGTVGKYFEHFSTCESHNHLPIRVSNMRPHRL
jgi:hypothetical protein